MNAESCCASLEVPEGTYDRTYTNSGSGPTGEADPATISGFRLDKYLVTVGRFRPFVAAWSAGYAPPAGSGKHGYLNGGLGLANSGSPGTYEPGWLGSDDSNVSPTDPDLACNDPTRYNVTWTAVPGSQEALPVSCITWQEAYAFCIWDGGFLPSEAEWEYAAAGGGAQREYPWGSMDPDMDDGYAIHGNSMGDCYYGFTLSGYTCEGVRNIAPVGTPPRGTALWGQTDMAGELWEWTLDSYAQYVDPCVDCSYVTLTSTRVERGGDFSGSAAYLIAAGRADFSPTDRSTTIGFRCARAP